MAARALEFELNAIEESCALAWEAIELGRVRPDRMEGLIQLVGSIRQSSSDLREHPEKEGAVLPLLQRSVIAARQQMLNALHETPA